VRSNILGYSKYGIALYINDAWEIAVDDALPITFSEYSDAKKHLNKILKKPNGIPDGKVIILELKTYDIVIDDGRKGRQI
jgi:hypothetical protein